MNNLKIPEKVVEKLEDFLIHFCYILTHVIVDRLQRSRALLGQRCEEPPPAFSCCYRI
jgi:hypothetical protein